MDKLIEKLNQLLSTEFPGSSIEWDNGERVAGVLVWGDFSGVPQTERQRRVWDVLRAQLSPKEQLRVLALLTVTPGEKRVMERPVV